MAHAVLTPDDVVFIKEAKRRGALIPITPQTFSKVDTMVYVMCNSGPELQDRLMFAWENLAKVVFPVMTFGGITRLASDAAFFDEGVMKGVHKVVNKLGLKYEDLGCEVHFPCRDACEVRNLTLRETILHGIKGHQHVYREFGDFRHVHLFGHFTYNDAHVRRDMETFLINPNKMAALIVDPKPMSSSVA